MKNLIINSSQLELLKWSALIFMIFDHLIKFNIIIDNVLLFSLGRLVFPLFSFLLAYNYIYNTKSKEKYIIRLLIFAIISQFSFSLFFGVGLFPFINNNFVGNIFYTLSISLSIIYFYEKRRILLLFLVSIISIYINYDYGVGGILLTLSFYTLLKFKNILIIPFIYISYIIANTVVIKAELNSDFNLLSLFIVIPILILLILKNITLFKLKINRINKWFFYLFYPLHFFILGLISISI